MKANLILLFILLLTINCSGQTGNTSEENSSLDKQVEDFLNSNSRFWRDMNVPYSDGQILYDLIVENGYKNILEIGTSTGHSTIWLAWAASKTGGKVTTIEINERRHNQALENFKEAGVEQYIDARLADAHQLVKELEGPFDFVFSDADKEWYKNYFIDVYPKLTVGGCFTAHNVSMRSYGIQDFLDYLETVPDLETTISRESRSGISISYKR